MLPCIGREDAFVGQALKEHPAVLKAWRRFSAIVDATVGEIDDLTPADFVASPLEALDDSAQLRAFREQIRSRRPAIIDSAYPGGSESAPAPTGMRILGQRYTRPAHLLHPRPHRPRCDGRREARPFY